LAVTETKSVQGRDDGGPAFGAQTIQSSRIPNGYTARDGVTETMTVTTGGMTLRDYFAAKAAQGMLTTSGAPSLGGLDGYEDRFAAAAYKIADAKLKARSA
jgi:hypothetical protein